MSDPIRSKASRPETDAYRAWSCPQCGDYHAPCANEQIATAQARIAVLTEALGGITQFLDEEEMFFDSGVSVDRLGALLDRGRAAVGGVAS